MRDGAGPQSSEEYDAVGNLVKTTDALGRVTVYEYDELDRLKKVIQSDPDLFFDTNATPPAWVNGPLTSPITQYGYDKVGNLKTVIDPNQGITTYNYDFRNRLTSTLKAPPRSLVTATIMTWQASSTKLVHSSMA